MVVAWLRTERRAEGSDVAELQRKRRRERLLVSERTREEHVTNNHHSCSALAGFAVHHHHVLRVGVQPARCGDTERAYALKGAPTVSKQVKSASLEAASSSTCGGGWAPSGWGLTLGVPSCPEPPGAPWEGTAGELEHCEDGHFDGAVTPMRAALARSAESSAHGSNQPSDSSPTHLVV